MSGGGRRTPTPLFVRLFHYNFLVLVVDELDEPLLLIYPNKSHIEYIISDDMYV